MQLPSTTTAAPFHFSVDHSFPSIRTKTGQDKTGQRTDEQTTRFLLFLLFDSQLTDFLFSLFPFFLPSFTHTLLALPPVPSPFPFPFCLSLFTPHPTTLIFFPPFDPSTHSQNDTRPSFFSLLCFHYSLLSPPLSALHHHHHHYRHYNSNEKSSKNFPGYFPRYLTEAARSFNHRPTISRPHDPWPPTHSLPRTPCLHQSQPSSTAETAGRGVSTSI